MLTHRYDDALRLASDWHRAQRRKGTSIPYISHLLSVSALVLEYGGDEDEAIGGLLHDAIEDAGQTEESVARLFGANVARIVAECSDHTSSGPKPDWTSRKRAYIASVATKSDSATLVTACDKLHNATAILADLDRTGEAVFSRFTAGRDGTLWYYRELSRTLSSRLPGDLTARLARTVDALHDRAG